MGEVYDRNSNRFHYLRNPRKINSDYSGANYWDRALMIYYRLFSIENCITDFLFTEPDPFVRPDHKLSNASIDHTIREHYELTHHRDNEDELPFGVKLFDSRRKFLADLLKRPAKD